MSILVIGATFVDIKGFPMDNYIPTGRNVGRVEYLHGGVARNVVEDIANVELRPMFLGIVDDTPMGAEVLHKLQNHKVDTRYVQVIPEGMGTWLAVFDNNGDVAGSISKRPNLLPILDILQEKGDEIFSQAESVVLEVDMEKEIIKLALELAQKHGCKTFGVVSNMSIAAKRRDFLQKLNCFICNKQEAGQLFLNDYEANTPAEMEQILKSKVTGAKIPSMVVTLGDQGAIYADMDGNSGMVAARNVQVKDTTGAGDAFCAGVAIGLTYGKTLAGAIDIGSTLAASVITSSENVCPRFLPGEFGITAE